MIIGFGVLGWALRKMGFSLASIILGVVLGNIFEDNLRRALSISAGDWSILLQSGTSIIPVHPGGAHPGSAAAVRLAGQAKGGCRPGHGRKRGGIEMAGQTGGRGLAGRGEAMQRAGRVLMTLTIGGIGAFAAAAAGLPAAALLGATLAVTLASLCRLPAHIPAWLRNMAFAAIGCSLGSGVDGDFLQLAGKWSMSLAGLVLAMAVILAAGSLLLTSFFGQSRETALPRRAR